MYPLDNNDTTDTGGLPIIPPKKNGKQLPLDTGGLPILKKKEVGTESLNNGGQVGTSVPQSVRDNEDQVGEILQPHVEKLKVASGNFYNQPQVGEQQGHAPLLTNISDVKEQQKPAVTPKQEKDVAEKNLVTVSNIVKKTAFQNGNQAKDYIKKKVEKYGDLDLRNQTNQLAKERSDQFDKIKNDVYGEDGTGSIAAAALKEKMESDPNFHQKFINMHKEGIDLPQEEEASLIADYTAKHQGDLEELSKENPDIKTDYEDVTKNLLKRFPDYGKLLVAQKITNEREKRNLNSSIGNFNTATASKHNNQIANDILDPEEQKIFQDNRQEIESKIVKGGFLNNLANIKDLPSHTKDAIEGYAGLDKSSGEAAYDEMQGKVADPSKGWKQVAGTLGDLTGKMLYMAAISKGLGAAGVPAEAASKLAVPATFGKEILDESRSEFPDDDTKAKVSAFLKTGLLTFLNPVHADKAVEAVNGILSKATDTEAAATLRGKLIKGILGAGKEVSTAAAQNLTYTAAAQVVDKALGMDEEAFRQFHPEGEAAESIKQGAIMGVIPGVLKGASEFRKSPPTATPNEIPIEHPQPIENTESVKKEEPTPIEKVPSENTKKQIEDKYPTEEQFKNADQIVSHHDAESRLSNGERIFGVHEMDEGEGAEPIEIKNVGELKGYAPDQLLAIPRDYNPFEKTPETKPIEEQPTEVNKDLSKRSDADIENRMSELEPNLKVGTPEHLEFDALEKEMEKRERSSVFDVTLDKVNDAVDALMKKEKEQPNGFGSFIERRDAIETKEVANKYLGAEKISDKELKKDFEDAALGRPSTQYADGLKLRESMKEATNRGITVDELTKPIEDRYVSEGYTPEDAKGVIAMKLKPILETAQKPKTQLPETKPIEEQPTEVGKAKENDTVSWTDNNGHKSEGEVVRARKLESGNNGGYEYWIQTKDGGQVRKYEVQIKKVKEAKPQPTEVKSEEPKVESPKIKELQDKKAQLIEQRDNPPTRNVIETNDEGEVTGKVVQKPLKEADLNKHVEAKNAEISKIDEQIEKQKTLETTKPKLDDLPFLKAEDFDKAKNSDHMDELVNRQKEVKKQFKNLRKITECIWAI